MTIDRSDLYVVARILERLWKEERPMLRTRLQLASRVNHDVFTRYLDWMQGKGLAEMRDDGAGREGVPLTGTGSEAYRVLVRWINDVIAGPRT